MNIGIDFGSTITIASTYNRLDDKLDALDGDSKLNINVPTVLTLRKDKLRYGTIAKDLTGMPKAITLKGFKMLLSEKNPELLKKRGYDNEHSPEWATEEFLKNLLATLQDRSKESEIENLVVGAPDIWFHRFSTLSGRALVHDICAKITGQQNVRIVSEPVLASAYFAFNYKRKMKRAFEGNILIVDYGGGTLDLSLTQVTKGRADQKHSMEIKMLESNGAGENTDHSVGKASIVYMESLMEYVIRKNNPSEADQVIGTSDFYKAVNDLESMLVAETTNIADLFEELGIDAMDELEEEELDIITCDGEDYPITLADLVEVYDRTIRNVFQEKMDEMIAWAKEDKIDVLNPNQEHLKLALVGGFGGFYLVKKQMEDTFKRSSQDMRWDEIIDSQADCERAISYGAALIASGEVGICSTAPYSIGIMAKEGDVETIDYMVHHKDNIDINRPYFCQMKDAQKPKFYMVAENRLSDFMIDYGRSAEPAIRLSVKEELRERLSNLVKNKFRTCCIGISFNESEIMSLHIQEYDFLKRQIIGEETIIELGQLKDCFEEIKSY